MCPRAAAPPSLGAIAARVDRRLRDFLDAETARWRAVDPALARPLDALRHLVEAGGKRLRPAFCHWGFVAAGGDPDDPRAAELGAAVEMLHAIALVHDDVMDGSPTRRGAPSVHVAFTEIHRAAHWHGEPRRFGEGAAVLVGDMAHVYADVLLGDAPPDVWNVWHDLRLELDVGQYLDLLGTARADRHRACARRIARYKSGKYTIERPLHLGAAQAGRLADVAAPLSAYGKPLGEAFQLRDDVLGAFGDPARTGKPVGEDLREGKPTPLLAAAFERVAGSPAPARGPAAALLARVGDPGLTDVDVAAIQQVILDTGALDEIERLIGELTSRAVAAIEAAEVCTEARHELVELARYVAARDS
jgi:geranylgeranyl diphosphate synthase type I